MRMSLGRSRRVIGAWRHRSWTAAERFPREATASAVRVLVAVAALAVVAASRWASLDFVAARPATAKRTLGGSGRSSLVIARGLSVRNKQAALWNEKSPERHWIEIQPFYEESIAGPGGVPKGIERDLITKFFGNGDNQGKGDHAAALRNLQEQMTKGEPFEGEDDGQGWIWLAADMHKTDGLFLELRKSERELMGRRPLLVARQDNVAALFEKANWAAMRRRINEVIGRMKVDKGKTQNEKEDAVEPPAGQAQELVDSVSGLI